MRVGIFSRTEHFSVFSLHVKKKMFAPPNSTSGKKVLIFQTLTLLFRAQKSVAVGTKKIYKKKRLKAVNCLKKKKLF